MFLGFLKNLERSRRLRASTREAHPDGALTVAERRRRADDLEPAHASRLALTKELRSLGGFRGDALALAVRRRTDGIDSARRATPVAEPHLGDQGRTFGGLVSQTRVQQLANDDRTDARRENPAS